MRKFWMVLPLLVMAAPPLQAKDAKDVIMPEDAGNLAFQSAVGYAGESDLKPAFTRAFDRISRTLERAGVSWDDVVDLTSYHTDLQSSINEMVEVKNRYVKAPFATWTAIGISALYEADGVVEIKIVAQRRGE